MSMPLDSLQLKCLTTVLVVLVAVVPTRDAIDNCTLAVERNGGQCPTWFVPTSINSSVCICGPGNDKALLCDSNNEKFSLKIGYCMTYNQTSKITYEGQCPYSTKHDSINYLFYKLPNDVLQLNEYMCGHLNRTGLLCSQCQEGLGPAVFSPYRECLECMDKSYGWMLYFFMAIIPSTVLCLFVIIFRINAASPSLNGFVLAAQLINSSRNVEYINTSSLGIIVVTCYGFWNLDFFIYVFPSFCIEEGWSTLTVIALEYTVALYPIIFTVVVYYCITLHDNGCRIIVCCWKPFHWCCVRFRSKWELKGSVINAFATFLLLSYSKICLISFSLMQSSRVYDICDNHVYKVYYDTSYERLSKEHLFYVIPASIVSIIFIFLPALFILFYQNKFFQKCLSCCKVKCVLIHELANICQGCFKNGTTPGTRDYRWFAGLYLLLRILFIAVNRGKHSESVFILVPNFMAILIALLRPYRNDIYNKVDCALWTTASIAASCYIIYILAFGYHYFEALHAFLLVPLLYMTGLVTWKLIILIYRKFRLLIANKRQGLSSSTDLHEQDEQLPDRLLQPSKYPPLLSASKHLTLSQLN